MTAINTLKAHLAINVNDVKKSIDFYKRMLGIEPSKSVLKPCETAAMSQSFFCAGSACSSWLSSWEKRSGTLSETSSS